MLTIYAITISFEIYRFILQYYVTYTYFKEKLIFIIKSVELFNN